MKSFKTWVLLSRISILRNKEKNFKRIVYQYPLLLTHNIYKYIIIKMLDNVIERPKTKEEIDQEWRVI